MLNIVLWLPLAVGLFACLTGKRAAGWVSVVGTLVSLGLAIALVADFDTTKIGLQHVVDDSWIPDLGVRYTLGVDGLNLFLILLTSLLWAACTIWSALDQVERPRTWFLMFGIGQTAVLGAFLAQDLLLFVLFFDLMLVPFYFLFGSWGEGEDKVKAVIKMMVYTLVGSLLMLVGAIATGVLAADGGNLTFSLGALAADPLGKGTQQWIFWFFAAAFLVKMPAFLLHGWMPDTYRVAPLPALALFSGVLSKVGAYGFLRVVLPIFPDATQQYQEVILILALASILYGSIMAFTQTSARLVAGYSSIAQLGFITLGVFSLRADGADGAILQMVNHGLVVAPVFLVLAWVVSKTKTDDLTKLGGFATKAPALAALFLVLTMALLAIPGSANFIGEFYILNSIFQTKIAIALIATVGVAMAAFYALRMYQRALHNRVGPAGADAAEIPLFRGIVIGSLVASVIALAFYPQVVLKRTDVAVGCFTAETATSNDSSTPGVSAGAGVEAVFGCAPAGIGAGAVDNCKPDPNGGGKYACDLSDPSAVFTDTCDPQPTGIKICTHENQRIGDGGPPEVQPGDSIPENHYNGTSDNGTSKP